MARGFTRIMPLLKLEEFVAYQLAIELKQKVFALIYNSPAAKDVKLASQISDAASSVPSDLSEGYHRFNPAEFATFVKYSRSSLAEVIVRLPDGVGKGYYGAADIEEMLTLARRLEKVLAGLHFSLRRQADRKREAKRAERRTNTEARRRPRRNPRKPPST